MIAKTIQVLAATALFATSLPVLADKDADDDDRERRYRHKRVVVVHHYPVREVVPERPLYVERTVVLERPVYIELLASVESTVSVYARPLYARRAYDPAQGQVRASPARAAIGKSPVAPPQLESAYERARNVERTGAGQLDVEIASERPHEIVSHAIKHIGVPYRYGGSSPRVGFDCSGFVRYVYQQAGIALPRNTGGMSQIGAAVRRRELEPGDLVFFDTRRKPFSHVGIYIGDQRFIHAPASGGSVQLVDMREHYWRARYVGARRVLL